MRNSHALLFFLAAAALIVAPLLVADKGVEWLPNSDAVPQKGLVGLWTFGPDGGLNAARWSDPEYNVLKNSNMASGWTINATPVITPNQSDPTGGTTAIRIDADGAGDGIYSHSTLTILTAAQHTWSVWLKGVAGNENIQFGDDSSGGAGVREVSLTTSWTRYVFTGTPSSGGRVFVLYPAGTVPISYFAWGAQINPGTIQPYSKTEARQRVWDWSGNANHFQVGSAAESDTNDPSDLVEGGKIVAARGDFGGIDDYVDLAALSLSGDWSFVAVIRPDDNTTRGLWRNGTASPNISLDAAGKVAYAGGATVTATNAVAQAEWHMIGITNVGGTITHYLDGAPNGSGSSGSGNAFTALRAGYDGTTYFDGGIAFFDVHSRALSADTIARQYRLLYRQLTQQRGMTMAVPLQ